MELKFLNEKFRFVINYNDLTDYLEKIYTLVKDTKTGDIMVKNENLHFEKLDKNISIDFDKNHFEIYSEPICFVNGENKSLFKIYNDSDLKFKNDLLKVISLDYDFYLPNGNKISYDQIGKNNIKLITLKVKINQYENIFKPLCKELPIDVKDILINTNCFLPDGSPSLRIDINSNLKLIVGQRNVLINKILEFMKNEKKMILKIYGTDGIGKSVTFLYFTTIKTDYKIIYFNLKDIYKFNPDKTQYFKNALMKYYATNCHYDLREGKQLTKQEERVINYYYDQYLKCIKNMDMKNIFSNDFWEMLAEFCKYITYIGNSIIIIDQYKEEYDQKKKLDQLLKNINRKQMKFIVSSSLNDNTVKEKLRVDLMRIFREEIKLTIFDEKTEEIGKSFDDFVDEIFANFQYKQNEDKADDDNDDFSNISLFNETIDDSIKFQPKDKKEEIANNIDFEKNLISNLNLSYPNKDLLELTDTIYINNLISVESIVQDEDDNEKDLYRLFVFNPKTYTKYKNFLDPLTKLSQEQTHLSFLNERFDEIKVKINSFYNILEKKFKGYSQERLKGTFLIKLNEIIEKKTKLNLNEIIQYLEIFPFKYLKIYLADIDSKLKDNNIISLDEQLKEQKFILDYSYEFIEIAFSKIIDMISLSTLIDMKDLSGSAIGSLLENKIKRNLENEGFIIRYLWNFSSEKVEKKEKKYIYDYNSYKKIELKYDDIDNNPIKDQNKYYYVIPGSQTNKSLDAVILQPYSLNFFNMISLQITKFKQKIKSKKEYIKACFKAKDKFETTYNIKINKMYFYFILAEDFDNEITKRDLELDNISYFYYSIKNENFIKDKDSQIYFNNLDDYEAEIFSDDKDNAFQTFDSKLTSVNLIEKFLQKKRRSYSSIKITENFYDSAMMHIFKQSTKIYLDEHIKKNMEKLITIGHTKHSSKSYIFKFVFYIHSYELFKLAKHDDLIGLVIHYNQKGEKIYSFFYKGLIYPNDEDIPAKLLGYDKNRARKKLNLGKTCLVSQIPEIYWDLIFVFKLYILKKAKNENIKE